MHLRRYQPNDAAEMATWYEARNMPRPRAELLPNTGFFIPGVAAGFLYLTNSRLAYLENYITNPHASGQERYDAMVLGTRLLFALSKEAGVERVVALCNLDLFRNYLTQSHAGFKYGEYDYMVMEVPK